MKSILSTLLIGSVLTLSNADAQSSISHLEHKELGSVAWQRDYDTALQLSKQSGKPILILFQEVPGCATCRNYGRNILSQPLLAEAIQDQFIALTIFNNHRGADKEVLELYHEPSWNNPVVRIIDHHGKDLIPRVAGDYSALGLSRAMIRALKEHGSQVPGYLEVLSVEFALRDGDLREAYYKMYCFWSGETQLGSREEVLTTESGFGAGGELVRVVFDVKKLSRAELDRFAQSKDYKVVDAQESFRPSQKDIHYHLRHSAYATLPLSELQKTRINSALGSQRDPRHLLSPQQMSWLDDAKTSDMPMIDLSLQEAWDLRQKS